MIRSARIAVACSLAALTLAAGSARAADDPKPDEKLVPKLEPDNGRKNGVDAGLTVGATSSFGNNSNVLGQADGSTFTFGLKFLALVNYNEDKHEWRNTLNMGEGLSRTPVVPQFVKSRDAAQLESIYLYHVVDWFGPFARFQVDTSLFRGADVRAGDTTYVITHVDGSTDTRTGTHLSLTDPFRPMTLKESIGPFARPVSSERVNLEFRLGLGAREILAKNQLTVTDDDKTPQIEVTELRNVNQLGVEGVVAIWGALEAKKVTYRVSAEAMTPLAHSDLPAGDNRGDFDLTNVDLGALLSFKLVEWASLDYELKAVRQPQLLDRFQVQNNLLLVFGLSAGNVPKPK